MFVHHSDANGDHRHHRSCKRPLSVSFGRSGRLVDSVASVSRPWLWMSWGVLSNAASMGVHFFATCCHRPQHVWLETTEASLLQQHAPQYRVTEAQRVIHCLQHASPALPTRRCNSSIGPPITRLNDLPRLNSSRASAEGIGKTRLCSVTISRFNPSSFINFVKPISFACQPHHLLTSRPTIAVNAGGFPRCMSLSSHVCRTCTHEMRVQLNCHALTCSVYSGYVLRPPSTQLRQGHSGMPGLREGRGSCGADTRGASSSDPRHRCVLLRHFA